MSAPVVLCQSSCCPNSNPPSRMECPTCNKLQIKGSYFCTQECFRAECELEFILGRRHTMKPTRTKKKTHKLVHELVTLKTRSLLTKNIGKIPNTYNPFPDFPFTGSVRPMYPLSPRREVPEHIARPDYAEKGEYFIWEASLAVVMKTDMYLYLGRPLSEYKELGKPPKILTKEEQEKMRVVCKLSREVLDIAASHVRPGISTDELDEIVHNACIERNAYPSPLNYNLFPKSFCTSVNEVICHGIPDQRVLQEGDIINLDVSLYHNGVHGDLNATYPVGNIDEESQKLIKTCRESLDAAIRMCKPGALFRDVGKVIEPLVKANGCSVVRTYVGHGINSTFHPPPNVPHYAKNKAIGVMKPGIVFTIEPMVNLGTNNSGEVHWPDNWTATTVDGRRSAQFEETLLITDDGVEVLTAGKEFVL
ncbi:methionine aminopeptidase [Marasmius fiardii PR-910]|nr:methionine aminopeptidase [Marasmius fiardii PR-910]